MLVLVALFPYSGAILLYEGGRRGSEVEREEGEVKDGDEEGDVGKLEL